MSKIILNDGNTIPSIGFGTYRAVGPEGFTTVKLAIETGYRMIDTASKYNNEESVGKGIKASGVPREAIFITTKLWREHLSYEAAKIEFEKSLKHLGVSYIDLYLIHWPANALNYDNWQEANAESWRAMEELQTQGKIKSIGVSNFYQQHLEELSKTAMVTPAVNQIEFHPGYWQEELVSYCQSKGIVVQGWSPFMRGKIFENKFLISLAEKYTTSIPQICLKWMEYHHVVPIVKSVTPKRIVENLKQPNFEFTLEEIKKIDQLPKMGYSGESPYVWPGRID